MSDQEVASLSRSLGVDIAVDLKFCDMLGTWQHCTYPIDTLDESIFEDGFGFDGSSIRGWQATLEKNRSGSRFLAWQ